MNRLSNSEFDKLFVAPDELPPLTGPEITSVKGLLATSTGASLYIIGKDAALRIGSDDKISFVDIQHVPKSGRKLSAAEIALVERFRRTFK